jgi:hypothetical protein
MEFASPPTRILVGGFTLRIAPSLWRDVGADYWTKDASDAISLTGGLHDKMAWCPRYGDVLLQLDQNAISLSVRDYRTGKSAERLARMSGSGSDLGVRIAVMRERLNELGGTLEILSDSSGTLLKASAPLLNAV